MKRMIIVAALALSLSACANMSTGQSVGTLGGAAAGGLLGSLVGGGTGRLVAVGAGTLIGAIAGGTVGHSVDHMNTHKHPYTRGANAGEDSAYNRGRADYEAEQQRLREERAYQRGRTGQ